jgi:hypothetical protein
VSLAPSVGRRLAALGLDPRRLDLRLATRGWRWPISLADRIEVWQGTTLLGELTGDALHAIITHYLAGAVLAAGMLDQLETPPRRPLAQRAARTAGAEPDADLRAQRRAQRRARTRQDRA